MKRIFVLLFAVFLSVFQCSKSYSYDFEITKYSMNIDVKEDKTLSITEKIKVNFFEPRHGIYRTIPTKGKIRTKDREENYTGIISNIHINNQYSKSSFSENNTAYQELKIGSADYTVDGEQEYIINYDYKMSADKMKDADELYFNLVGSRWNAPISNFSFSIKMPKEFDKNKLWFYDKTGDSKDVKYSISKNTIQGKYLKTLHPGEAFTIHLKLPENYFEKSFMDIYGDYLKLIPFAIPVIFLLFIANFWYKYGKDEKTVEVVEFEPPDNIGPIEMAYIYRQTVSNADVATLLIHLANKGYLSIENYKNGFFNKDYKIRKLKDYNEENYSEKTFFKALFKEGDDVILSELEEDCSLCSASKKIINKARKNCLKVFDPKSLAMQRVTAILMIICWAIAAAYASLQTLPMLIIHAVLFPIVGYATLSMGIHQAKAKNYFLLLFGIFWCFVTTAVLGAFFIAMNPEVLIYLGVTIICIIIMDVFRYYMPRWTKEGNLLYGRVLGFKKYLEKVEADKLQRLVDKDPKYFYNIIPYAYIFGINSSWFKKFEGITCPPPDYYYGDGFSIHVFSNTINSSISSLTRASSPPQSNGSSSGGVSFGGGGGFSGGGGGGGGGGSW